MSAAQQILVVDNDPALCRLMEVAFARVGLEVRATGDAGDAAAILAAGEVSGLLMDLNLGAGMSGPELLNSWAPKWPMPPCWMVTGTPDDARLASVESLSSFQRVVAKPFSVLELADEVKSVVGGADEQEMST